MKRFTDRVAVITGAGSGMGRALAIRLADEGCHLALTDVQEQALEETAGLAAAAAADNGRAIRCTQATVDVADRAAMEAFAADAERAHGAIHLVFNNAGVALTGPFEHLSFEDLHWLMNINFWGVVHGCKAFLPALRRVDEAHIVNTSSVFGLLSVPGQSAYHAAKFAVKGLTDALRLELQGSSIRVSCVLPGGVKTGIVRSSRHRPADNESLTREELASQFERIAGLTAAEAAEEILRGVRKGKARILVGRDARMLAVLVRVFPVRYYPVIEWLSRRLARTGSELPRSD